MFVSFANLVANEGGKSFPGAPRSRDPRAMCACAGRSGARRSSRSRSISTISHARARRCRCSPISRRRCRTSSTISSTIHAETAPSQLEYDPAPTAKKRAKASNARAARRARRRRIEVRAGRRARERRPFAARDRRRAHRRMARARSSATSSRSATTRRDSSRFRADSTPRSPRFSPRRRLARRTSLACGFRIAHRARRASSTRSS